MKPLTLLSLGLLVGQALSSRPESDCPKFGLKAGQRNVVNVFRTDWCNPQLGRVKLLECRLPNTNKTIEARQGLKEGGKKEKNVYTCDANGPNGVTITHTDAKENQKIDATKTPGFCAEGPMMRIGGAQWHDGDFVKHCNNETHHTEYLACLSYNGTFVPIGTNITERFVDDLRGYVLLSTTECEAVGDSVSFKQVITITPTDAPYPEATPVAETTAVSDLTTAETTEAPKHFDCDAEENVGKEWVDGNFVMACAKNDGGNGPYKFVEIVTRCITPQGHEVDIKRDWRLDNGSVYDCVRLGPTRARLDLLSAEEAQKPRKCEDGRRVDETWKRPGFEMICKINDIGKPTITVVACTSSEYVVPERQYRILLGETEFVWPSGYKRCTPTEDGMARLEHASPCCEKGKRIMGEEWNDGRFVKSCVYETRDIADAEDVIVVIKACLVGNVTIPVGEERNVVEMGTCSCNRGKKLHDDDPTLDAEIMCFNAGPGVWQPNACENGKKLGQESLDEDGVLRFCNKQAQYVAVTCMTRNPKTGEYMDIDIGEKFHMDGIQYNCEERGEFDATLVKKAFSQLCEDGDTSFDAWIYEGVLRDCNRTSEKPTVHARLCVLEDNRLLEVGEFIIEEFITYQCDAQGDFDALLTIDQSRIHADYFTKSGICMNGRKVGEEWTDASSIRRACRKRKGSKPVIVELGCVLPDGRIIGVGSDKPFTYMEGKTEVNRTYRCDKGESGLYVFHTSFQLTDHSRRCANSKLEGEEWVHTNVLRTCKEVDDKMTIVAIRCVFGNDTLEIGELIPASNVSFVECVRVGEHDAAAVIDLAGRERVCENGKKLNEEWTENQVRRACRIRNRRVTVVALGCVLEDGRPIGIGEKDRKTVIKPGYEVYLLTYCLPKGENDAEVSLTRAQSNLSQNEKSPCGKNKYGTVWESGRFLKKCKVMEDRNVLSAVTIGCVTLKGTRMLEGQTIEEDDYHMTCGRNESGKLQLHHSFTIMEK